MGMASNGVRGGDDINNNSNENTNNASAAAAMLLNHHKVSSNFFGVGGVGSFSNTYNNLEGHTMFFLPSDNMPLIKPDPAMCKNEKISINIFKNRIQFNRRNGVTIKHVVLD